MRGFGPERKFAQAQDEAELKLLQTRLKLASAQEKADFENRLTTLKEYYDQRNEIEQKGTEVELEIIAKEVQKLLLAAPAGSKEKLELQGEMTKLLAESAARAGYSSQSKRSWFGNQGYVTAPLSTTAPYLPDLWILRSSAWSPSRGF